MPRLMLAALIVAAASGPRRRRGWEPWPAWRSANPMRCKLIEPDDPSTGFLDHRLVPRIWLLMVVAMGIAWVTTTIDYGFR